MRRWGIVFIPTVLALALIAVLNMTYDRGELMATAPSFSVPDGFYDEEFDLSITYPEGTRVYYTLDGSTPDEDDILYEGPIHVHDRSEEDNTWRGRKKVVDDWITYDPDETPVDKAFIVRAVAVDASGVSSDITNGVYFIGHDHADGTVLSLIADDEELFGDNGIYMTGTEYDEWYESDREEDRPDPNFNKKGPDTEIEGDVEIFRDGFFVGGQKAGIRITGATSRLRPVKRFSLYSRKRYSGSDWFSFPLFDGDTRVHSVTFKESVADAVFPELASDCGVFGARYEKARVYVNGEFWYDTFIREKYSKNYFETRYGIRPEDLVVFKDGYIVDGDPEEIQSYLDLYAFLEDHDPSDEDDYRELCSMMDMDNYIMYNCINLYAVNMDFNDYQNVIMWKSAVKKDDGYYDGRWRWALFDMDALDEPERWQVLDYPEGLPSVDSLHDEAITIQEPFADREFFKALEKNPGFVKEFEDTFERLAEGELSAERGNALLKSIGEDPSWNDSFFDRRASYMRDHLNMEFHGE